MKNDSSEQRELVSRNLGLVHSCANRFRGKGVDYDDLFQSGCIGLAKAANNFDSERGFAFSTYAVPVILGEIKRNFRDGGLIKVGRTFKEKSRTAMKVSQQLQQKLGREPTVSEIAEEMKIEICEAAELIAISMPVLSMSYESEKGEAQFDVPVSSGEEELTERLALKAVLDKLEEKDRRLIQLRYYEGFTQVRTAQELGMSQVQVSRREKAILLKMRKDMLG